MFVVAIYRACNSRAPQKLGIKDHQKNAASVFWKLLVDAENDDDCWWHATQKHSTEKKVQMDDFFNVLRFSQPRQHQQNAFVLPKEYLKCSQRYLLHVCVIKMHSQMSKKQAHLL